MAESVTFSPEIAARICAEMTDGKSLRSICDQDGMPTRVSVWLWRGSNPDFAAQFDAASREGARAMVDDIMAISDNDVLDPNDKRIRVDTRKWIASKVLPKVYGDKLAIGGNDDGVPIQISWTTADS